MINGNGFAEYLCLVRQNEDDDWYMLCVNDETMFVFSAGPLETIKNGIAIIKKRYGTAYAMSEAIHDMENPPRKTLHSQVLRDVYEYQNHQYDGLLRQLLQETNPTVRHKLVKPSVGVKKPTVPKLKKRTPVVVETQTKAKPLQIKKPMNAQRTKKQVFKRTLSKARLNYSDYE